MAKECSQKTNSISRTEKNIDNNADCTDDITAEDSNSGHSRHKCVWETRSESYLIPLHKSFSYLLGMTDVDVHAISTSTTDSDTRHSSMQRRVTLRSAGRLAERILSRQEKCVTITTSSSVSTVHYARPVARLPVQHARNICLLYTSPSPRDGLLSRMPSSA